VGSFSCSIEEFKKVRGVAYVQDEKVIPKQTKFVTVNSRPIRERCSKGGGRSNHPRKRHKEYAQREFEDILRG
jgi:hypothetical protein